MTKINTKTEKILERLIPSVKSHHKRPTNRTILRRYHPHSRHARRKIGRYSDTFRQHKPAHWPGRSVPGCWEVVWATRLLQVWHKKGEKTKQTGRWDFPIDHWFSLYYTNTFTNVLIARNEFGKRTNLCWRRNCQLSPWNRKSAARYRTANPSSIWIQTLRFLFAEIR